MKKPKKKAKPYPPEYTKDTKPDGPREIPEGYFPFDANFFTSNKKTPVVFDFSLGKGQFCPVKATCEGPSKSDPGCYRFKGDHGYFPDVNMYGCLLNGGPLVAYFKWVTKEESKHSDANPPDKDTKPEEDEADIPPWLKPFASSVYISDSRTPVIFRVRGPDSRIHYHKARLNGTDFARLQFKFLDDRSGDPLPVVNLLGKSINTGHQLAYFDLRKAEKVEVPDHTPRPKDLKPGFWREEGGGKAEVVEVRDPSEKDGYVDPGKYVAIGWNSKGRAQKWNALGKTFVSSDDLVEPWVDRVEWDWELAPPWFDWIMLGQRGDWYMFKDEPEHDCNGVVLPYGKHCFIPAEYAPKWTGDWRNSKTKRPSKP